MLLDVATGVAETVVVSLTDAAVAGRIPIDPVTDGQPPILLEEFVAVDEIVKADAGWVAAMAKRGITDLDLLRPCPLSAGAFDLAGRGRPPDAAGAVVRREPAGATTAGRTRSTASSPTST